MTCRAFINIWIFKPVGAYIARNQLGMTDLQFSRIAVKHTLSSS